MRIVTFYSFFEVSNLIFLENKIKEFSKKIEIKGNILLGPEGVNGTIAVSNHSKAITKSFLINLGVDEKNIKISEFNGKRIFNGFKIKKKKEIVTSDFELTANDMSQGQFIEPQVWDNFIQQEDVFIIDTRNEYEFRLGHFEKAIDPCINTFREFKGYIEDNKEKLKKRKLLFIVRVESDVKKQDH